MGREPDTENLTPCPLCMEEDGSITPACSEPHECCLPGSMSLEFPEGELDLR